ncbi:MAG: fatty acid desaturase family protein [Bacteroidota bacterium]
MSHHHGNNLNFNVAESALKPLFTTNAYRHALAMAFDWAIIITAVCFCIHFFNPFTYLLTVIVVGARMHALAILMHDSTHYRFLKNRKWNDLITNLLTMYPLFTSIETYRENHLRHHRHLNTEDDPDWVAKLGKPEFTFPKTKAEFIGTVFSYLTLYQGLRDAAWFLKRFGSEDKKADKKQKTAGKKSRLLFYFFLVGILTITGGWKYFALYWVVPFLSTFFMFQYIRSVAEHYGELSYDHLLTSTRSVKATALERFFIAPHNVGYHLEHHLYPGVPFYNLEKLHDVLMESADYSDKAHVTEGYLSGLLNELGAQRVAAF